MINIIDRNHLKLPDIIDTGKLQRMADLIHSAAGFPIGLIGVDNTIYVASGWQDICTKFHRVCPESCERCFKSDAYIKDHLNDEARFVEYKCLNGLWDIASPVIIDGRHLATLFFGQFFYSEDEKNIQYFKKQAEKFGFDETKYLAALANVPVFNRAKVEAVLGYYQLLLKTIIETGDSKYQKLAAIEQLKKTELSFLSLFNSMNEGVALHKLVFDDSGKAVDYIITDINPQYEKILGVKREDIVNKKATEAYHVDEAPYLNEFCSVALGGAPYQFETYFAPMKKYFSISVISHEENHFATIFFDITQNRLAEIEREKLIKELENKNAELERFTYTVSHDLKSPLITIKGFLGMLETDMAQNNEPRIKSDIKRIADAADKMSSLLDDLLELSRIGRIINPPSVFSLDGLVKEVKELLNAVIGGCGAELIIDGELPDIYADRRRIFEVIQNLIENAIKFRRSGEKPLINIGAYPPDDGFVKIYVKDNGTGIEKRYFDNIFGLFNKLDSKSSGTGIGLALVRRIIEVHGGKIFVESEGINKGSVFYFTLPYKNIGG